MNGTEKMNADEIQYPNYESDKQSPDVDELGVQVRLAPRPAGGAYRLGESLILHGAYKCTLTMERQTGGLPLTEAVIVLRRVENGESWSRPIEQHAPGPPPESIEPAADDDATRVGGFFNLDLAEFMPEMDEPGRYIVRVELFEFKSDERAFDLELET